MRFSTSYLTPFLFAGILAFSVPAMAKDPSPTGSMALQATLSSEPAPLAESELGDISAGDDVTHNVVSNQNLNATNSGNSVTAGTVQSGNINFSGNALTGFSGVGNFVSNTGNNNNLQGSISINITGVPGVQ